MEQRQHGHRDGRKHAESLGCEEILQAAVLLAVAKRMNCDVRHRFIEVLD